MARNLVWKLQEDIFLKNMGLKYEFRNLSALIITVSRGTHPTTQQLTFIGVTGL